MTIDLADSGIDFQAHHIRNRQSRFSKHDLQVLGQHRTIKTSLHFIFVKRSRNFPPDFYVTRFYEGGCQRSLVILLQPQASEQTNGDTVNTTLENAINQFPAPAKVQIKDRPIVVIHNYEWKVWVLNKQPGQ